MVQNAQELQAFEDGLLRQERLTLEQKYRILDAMYEEAVLLGVLPSPDPLDGIEHVVRLARAINCVPETA